ncbi:MAG: 1-acyl-sn-glycerol-3-phosphate acyltransferase [Oscillospiraceae bacterium]|nr:1-acyl-sn-glycerol-3-phosphate acyltransferase [Oscillospiraceae bacterium]
MRVFLYRIIFVILRCVMFLVHPVLKVKGRERIPEGACVICPNHSALSDPVWLVLALHLKQMINIMAKIQLSHVPVIGPFLGYMGIIYVDRDRADVGAIKSSLTVLKADRPLVIFPEGTRVKPGKEVHAHTGAALLASRTDAPLIPVYITKNKKFLHPIHVVFGEPFRVEKAGIKATGSELQSATDELMQKIYELEEP